MMQTYNKFAAKKTFAHTWFIYPIGATIITLLLIWGFAAFHQPTNHQILKIFFATEVKNSSFTKNITKHYDKENLREVNVVYAHPMSIFYTKLKTYLEDIDMVVLPKSVVDGFSNHYSDAFVELSKATEEKYLPGDYTYYQFDEKDYGLLLKSKDESCWLDDYMSFIDEDYYLLLSAGSKNLGDIYDAGNAYYDNALTALKYVLGGE